MVLRKDLKLRRVPSYSEAQSILDEFNTNERYLKRLASEYILNSPEDYSTLVHVGKVVRGLAEKVCSKHEKVLISDENSNKTNLSKEDGKNLQIQLCFSFQ